MGNEFANRLRPPTLAELRRRYEAEEKRDRQHHAEALALGLDPTAKEWTPEWRLQQLQADGIGGPSLRDAVELRRAVRDGTLNDGTIDHDTWTEY